MSWIELATSVIFKLSLDWNYGDFIRVIKISAIIGNSRVTIRFFSFFYFFFFLCLYLFLIRHFSVFKSHLAPHQIRITTYKSMINSDVCFFFHEKTGFFSVNRFMMKFSFFSSLLLIARIWYLPLPPNLTCWFKTYS